MKKNNGTISMTLAETSGKIPRRIIAGSADSGHGLACTGSADVWTFDNSGNLTAYVHVYLAVEVQIGDINNDGTVNKGDILLLRLAVAMYDVDNDKEIANVETDNPAVNIRDILKLRTIAAKLAEAPAYAG